MNQIQWEELNIVAKESEKQNCCNKHGLNMSIVIEIEISSDLQIIESETIFCLNMLLESLITQCII